MRKLSSYIGRYWYGYVFAVASMVTAIALDMLYPKITQKICLLYTSDAADD